jgi:hypothetical protein
MPSPHRHTPALPAKVSLTLTDLTGVQRVLVLLTGRRHPFTHFEAQETGGGRWRLSLDTSGDRAELELLEARLLRSPAVLTVDVRCAAELAVAG